MKQEILDWLTYDRQFKTGVLLYFRYGKNRSYINIFNTQGFTQSNLQALFEEFRLLLGINLIEYNKLMKQPVKKKVETKKPEKQEAKFKVIVVPGAANPDSQKTIHNIKSEQKLRYEFPFLSQPDCPDVLKILVADKITAFAAYRDAHQKLFTAADADQFNAIKDTVENFIINRQIYKELNHYKQHHKILGDHPVFEKINMIDDLQKMKTEDLVIRKDNLKKYILRKNHEIELNDKPHLKKKKLDAIDQYSWELTEVEKIIETRK